MIYRTYNTKLDSGRVWIILLLLLTQAFLCYAQSSKQLMVLRTYKSEIDHWLLPDKTDKANTKMLAAFLVLPYLDSDYSVCLIDSAKHFSLKVQLLDKNLWNEVLTRAMKKQNMDLTMRLSVYSTSVSKRFKRIILSAFEKIGQRKTSNSGVNYDGISYEFKWVHKGEMKETERSYDLVSESYTAGLVKILDQIYEDIKNNTFKESNFIYKFK